MGLFVSLFQPPPKTKKQEDEEKKSRWRRTIQDFQDHVLHPSYVQHPIRANTIEAGEEYITGDSEASSDDATTATLLPGSHKHLGGAYDPSDGCIYGVPASAKSVLVLYPRKKSDKKRTTATARSMEEARQDKLDIQSSSAADPSQITYGMTCIPLPDSIHAIKFKWLRGIFHEGCLYAIPAWAPAVLCVDVDAFWGRRQRRADDRPIVTLIPLPPQHASSQWQWHGGSLNPQQTAIYCIPSNAQHVLKVDLPTRTCTLLDIQVDPQKYPNFRRDLSNKWYGGILGKSDHCIYGIPYRSCAVLQINCDTDVVRLIGQDYGLAEYNWHGGIRASNGKIYAHPSHADYSVLVIDTNKACQENDDAKCYELPIQRGNEEEQTGLAQSSAATTTSVAPQTNNNKIRPQDRSNYKWLGGSVGVDGHIYCPPCDVSALLQVNVTTEACTTSGFTGALKNKWQGGVLARDGCVYCIPASGRQVLRIATFAADNKPPAYQLLGNLPAHKDKWQGGHVGLDGNLYFIPENAYRVLRVVTPQQPPALDARGQLPVGDVTLELL